MAPTPNSASSRSVYLDHAATTPMYREVIEVMTAALATVGNAASLHGSGRGARRRVEESRETIAELLGARPSEVLFTGGGTESDNLAIKGIFWARRDADPRRRWIVASSVEHHAVLDAVQWLADHEGALVRWLPVTADGVVEPSTLRATLAELDGEVALVSVMWANNEVGAVMDIDALAAACQAADVPMHSDAIQVAGHHRINFADSGLSALSIAAHKFGGPHGVGALLLRRDVPCVPLLHGGGHERDVRSGTPDTPAAMAMATALSIALGSDDAVRLTALRTELEQRITGTIAGTIVNAEGAPRLPGIAHVTFLGCEGDSLLMLLDARGIECSTGSACTAGVAGASHVLTAMGVDTAAARGSLRFSLGHTTTRADIDAVIEALPQVVERARAAMLASAGARSTNGSVSALRREGEGQ